MGHATRNANRAAGIAKNQGRIAALAKKHGELEVFTAGFRKEIKDEVDVITDELESMEENRLALEKEMRFLVQPFWKRWWQSYMDHKVALVHARVRATMEIEKEGKMPKEEEKKPEPPATPSHRQVVVDRKVPGPGKKGEEPEKTKAESRDA